MPRRPLQAALLALASATMLGATASAQEPEERPVQALDNVFGPQLLRVPIGTEVVWRNEGRSPHTVTADDGITFDSGNLAPGEEFRLTLGEPGAYPYHCAYHGGPELGMAGVVVVGDATVPGTDGAVGPGREPVPAVPGPVIRVPRDAATIQEAVDAAQPGGLVLVSPGVYREAVRITTPYLTIRGTDRNRVILDGGFELANGIQVVEADGVVLENLTARHYLLNGFLWTGVHGYRGSYLTAHNNGDYGLFAFDSVWGQFDHSYASGHPDAGFYIGQCHPCHAVITDVLAENNALGYSGTNAGGDLYVVNSEWRGNMSGIVPNTLDSEENPPQRGIVIAGNWVHDNNNLGAPAKSLQYPSFGMGILVVGGRDNLVTQNLVDGHPTFGIAVLPMLDRNLWVTGSNEVRENEVSDSGRADLALGAPSEAGDCFAGNAYARSAPAAIEWLYGCGPGPNPAGGGELGATMSLLLRFAEALDGDFPHGDWRTAPPPPPQPNMEGASTAHVNPAVPEAAVPQPFQIRDARSLQARGRDDVSREVTVLGTPLATSWWGLLVGLYGYVLPVVLYSAWVSIALWDLMRREELPTGSRAGWMAGVLLVPLLGPIAYYALGGSPIPRALRLTLVAGSLVVYFLVTAAGFLIGAG